MNTTNRDQAERLIVDFLNTHDKPTAADWKRLTDQHPEHASAFVDAALIRAAGDAADASAEEYRLDEELATKTVSRALNKAHQLPSPTFEAARMKVEAIQGPAARRDLAQAVGIGQHTSLLNGVLAGRTRAPIKVLNALADALEVSAVALRELFARLFVASTVPAFKSTIGKPQLPMEPASWKDAVLGLGLAPEDTARLLKLDDDN